MLSSRFFWLTAKNIAYDAFLLVGLTLFSKELSNRKQLVLVTLQPLVINGLCDKPSSPQIEFQAPISPCLKISQGIRKMELGCCVSYDEVK